MWLVLPTLHETFRSMMKLTLVWDVQNSYDDTVGYIITTISRENELTDLSFHHKRRRNFIRDKYRNVWNLTSERGFSFSLGAGLLSEGMHIYNRAKLNSTWLYQLTCSAAFCCAAMCCCSAWSRKSLFSGDLASAMLQKRTRWYDTYHRKKRVLAILAIDSMTSTAHDLFDSWLDNY